MKKTKTSTTTAPKKPLVTLDCHPNVIIAVKAEEILFRHVLIQSGTMPTDQVAACFRAGFEKQGHRVTVKKYDVSGNLLA